MAGSDPIYVVYIPSKDKIYVGDLKANKVHLINPDTKYWKTPLMLVTASFIRRQTKVSFGLLEN